MICRWYIDVVHVNIIGSCSVAGTRGPEREGSGAAGIWVKHGETMENHLIFNGEVNYDNFQ